MTAERHGSFGELPHEAPYPGVSRSGFDSAGATVTRYRFEPGARFPLHRHPQEQITLIEEGEVEMAVAGKAVTLRGGEWLVVGPEVEHGMTAGPAGAALLAIVVPRRESPTAYTVLDAESL